MNISEATRAAMERGEKMTRGGSWWDKRLIIQPTNGPDRCIEGGPGTEYAPCGGWKPTADDLMADDWALCHY